MLSVRLCLIPPAPVPAPEDAGRARSGSEGWCSDFEQKMQVVGKLSLCGVMGVALNGGFEGVTVNGLGEWDKVGNLAGIWDGGGDLTGVRGAGSRMVVFGNGDLKGNTSFVGIVGGVEECRTAEVEPTLSCEGAALAWLIKVYEADEDEEGV
ncbi:hypothetical protein L208DRAFT_1381387 [Tricholoma matsutake]|nr:hypothetical protein L208DRAFT_1381387 [Tricholoma matsutake 945]